jgi:hypothetical protein
MSGDRSSFGSVSRQSDQIAGCFVGLAVGDALGAPLEFLSRRQVRQRYPAGLRDMIDSRLWRAGEYTDDTQMALLIAESLLENNGFQKSDLAQRFQTWAATAKDVGIQTRAVVNMAGYLSDPEGCFVAIPRLPPRIQCRQRCRNALCSRRNLLPSLS